MALSRTEDGRTYTHTGRAEFDGGFEIARHAHGKLLKAALPGKLRQQRKMRAGIFIGRRNAHQSLDLQFQLIPAKGHESNGLTRIDARLLQLKPGIDLNIKPKAAALLAAFLGLSLIHI